MLLITQNKLKRTLITYLTNDFVLFLMSNYAFVFVIKIIYLSNRYINLSSAFFISLYVSKSVVFSFFTPLI